MDSVELARHGWDKDTGEARCSMSGMTGMVWVRGCVWLWANSAGVMNHTFPYHSHSPNTPSRLQINPHISIRFRFNFNSLPDLQNCQNIPDHSAPCCGPSCRFSMVTTSRGIQDHAYMHFDSPRHNTLINWSTNRPYDITTDLVHS